MEKKIKISVKKRPRSFTSDLKNSVFLIFCFFILYFYESYSSIYVAQAVTGQSFTMLCKLHFFNSVKFQLNSKFQSTMVKGML